MDETILERFQQGIDLFNEHSFYDCHDVLEDVWFDVRGPSRRFYQGLIHLAVGFYHILEKENPKGAVSQLTKAIDKLSGYSPEFQGVEIESLLKQTETCLAEIKNLHADNIHEFNSKMIPKIKLNPARFVEP